MQYVSANNFTMLTSSISSKDLMNMFIVTTVPFVAKLKNYHMDFVALKFQISNKPEVSFHLWSIGRILLS